MTEFSPFSCPIFLGPPKSEWLLLPKRAAALWEGTQMLLRAEPGKQRPRSCRTQELARSRGPRKRVAEKGWLTRLDESQYDGRTTSTCERKKKRSRMYARGCCPLEELHRSEGGKVSYRWEWAIRGEESTGERSARFEERDRSPMEVADDGLEHRLRRLLPVADQPGVGPSLAGLTPL